MLYPNNLLISDTAKVIWIVDFLLRLLPLAQNILLAIHCRMEKPKRMTGPQRAERVRSAVLKCLASNQAQSYDFDNLLDRLNKGRYLGFTIKLDDLTDAIAFLEDMNFIKHRFHMLGSTRFYQATSVGVLNYERGLIEDD